MNAFLEAEAIDLFRIVHGEQKFAYERPIVAGDVLTATLTVASLRQIAGNDIIGTTSEVTDASGALVCSTSATLVHRGAEACSLTLETKVFTITRADLVRYAAASGDHNPIHQDEDVARSVGLPGVIAHGMYTMALAARAVAEWFPGAEVVSLGCKFTNPVVVPAEGGVDVEVAGEAKDPDEDGLTTVALTVTCDGQKVLGMPKAVIRA